MLFNTLVPLAFSFGLSLILTPAVRAAALRWRLVDLPDNKRKIHHKPIARIGGAAIFLALLSAGFAAALLWPDQRHLLKALAPAAVLVFAVGILDDVFGLKPWHKLAVEVMAGVVVVSAGIRIRGLESLGQHPWLGALLTILWLVLSMNALNLIDGLDGLAAGVASLSALAILATSLFRGDAVLAIAAALLLGALLGFLPYNFNPASIFLGDSGSLLIGFLLGCYSVLWSNQAAGVSRIAAPLIVLAVPLTDTTIAILRRFLRAQPIFTADRSHIHHRLLARGLSHRGAVLSLYTATAVAGLFAFGVTIAQGPWSSLGVAAFACCALVAIQRLGYVEFEAARRVLRPDAFQREVTAQLAVQAFEDRLSSAGTARDCWAVIQDASLEFGFHPIRMQLGKQKFISEPEPVSAPHWALRMPISQNGWIELSHELAPVDHASAVVPFAETIRKVLGSKTRSIAAVAH